MFVENINPDLIRIERDLWAAIANVMAKNPVLVVEYRNGRTSLMEYFIGEVMRILHGNANPSVIRGHLERIFSAD